ncbi:MAG: biotin-dependent carboxyltransferase family protein [Cyclobacteriaceae bacterium]|nr:biotin-dependent carboxyltransferase family protein [Cyclobacteriaceae bacterium]
MIKILKSGLYTSIQDMGRMHFLNYGVPISGVMDSYSASLSNVMVGNAKTCAVMEVTLQGPEMEFMSATRIAITGADLSPTLNYTPVEMNTSISIQQGDLIGFGERKTGARSYLAIAGGFQTALVFGSRSYFEGITPNATIKKGDLLPFNSSFGTGVSFFDVKKQDHPTIFNQQTLEVQAGPEFDWLSNEQQQKLLSNTYSLDLNNRMAYQLQPLFPNSLKSIISSAVLPGTVQLTPSGKIIVLMRDGQTTGGYPRIAQLTEQSINQLSQKLHHEKAHFRLV